MDFSGTTKYVHNHTAASELYNVVADPAEMNDLAGQPDHADIESALRNRLLSFWDPERIETEVLRTQERQKIARCKNVCRDLGY